MPITDEQVKAAQEAWGLAEEAGEDDADELWRVALEAYEESLWHPIETAPKDGTEVIIADAFGADVAAFDGVEPLEEFLEFCAEDETADDYPAYVKVRELEANGWMRHAAISGDVEFISNPTRWRPLPPAPKEK